MKRLFIILSITVCWLFLFQITPKAQQLMPLPSEGGSGSTSLYGSYQNVVPELDQTHKGTLYQSGTADNQKKLIVDGIGPIDEFEYFPTKAFAIYKTEIFNAPYQSEVIGYLYSGMTRTITYTQTTESTYEKALIKSLQGAISKQVTAKFLIDILDIGISNNIAVQGEISKQIRTAETIGNTASESLTYPIYEDGLYYAERRANFMVYVIQTFDIVYKETHYNKVVGLYNNTYYNYEIEGYRLEESKVFYELKLDCGLFLSRYELDEKSNRIYKGPILNSAFVCI